MSLIKYIVFFFFFQKESLYPVYRTITFPNSAFKNVCTQGFSPILTIHQSAVYFGQWKQSDRSECWPQYPRACPSSCSNSVYPKFNPSSYLYLHSLSQTIFTSCVLYLSEWYHYALSYSSHKPELFPISLSSSPQSLSSVYSLSKILSELSASLHSHCQYPRVMSLSSFMRTTETTSKLVSVPPILFPSNLFFILQPESFKMHIDNITALLEAVKRVLTARCPLLTTVDKALHELAPLTAQHCHSSPKSSGPLVKENLARLLPWATGSLTLAPFLCLFSLYFPPPFHVAHS